MKFSIYLNWRVFVTSPRDVQAIEVQLYVTAPLPFARSVFEEVLFCAVISCLLHICCRVDSSTLTLWTGSFQY